MTTIGCPFLGSVLVDTPGNTRGYPLLGSCVFYVVRADVKDKEGHLHIRRKQTHLLVREDVT
jgi:hypothetical protein